MSTSELIDLWLNSGNKITRLKPAKHSRALSYNPYSAYGRTMKIGNLGRKYNTHTLKVAGCKSNAA